MILTSRYVLPIRISFIDNNNPETRIWTFFTHSSTHLTTNLASKKLNLS